MEKTSDHYILILSGGSGPRLWPLSRASKPKQFLQILGADSLIKDTYNRFASITTPKNIFFVTNKKYLSELKKIFGKSVPDNNYIIEPEKKNTAAAILFATNYLKKINPDAIITATPADHFIHPNTIFKSDIKTATRIAKSSNYIVTIGIKPEYPNEAYGYILPASKTNDHHHVLKFIEKPSVNDANLLIRKNAFWNSGIYTFSINSILNEFQKYQPDYLKLKYKSLPSLSIDVAISEKSNNLVMIPAKFTWSDIGQWSTIWQQLHKDNNGIAIINKQGNYVAHNSSNCLISGDNSKLIGVVGINNLAIIDTPDSLLICNLNDSYAVRDLITKIVSIPRLKKYFLKNNDK